MTTKERIIKRLNKGFGFAIPAEAPCFTHQYRRNKELGAFSWTIPIGCYDIGSTETMTQCLKWKRWVFDVGMNEIFEYDPEYLNEYLKDSNVLIEKV